MRVLIVTTNAFAAETIRRELRHASGCQVLGYVDARRPCALAVSQAAPEVVLVDDSSAPDAVLMSVREARKGAPEAKLVLLTTRMDRTWLEEASRAGIDAAIAKTGRPATLGLLVREVVAGNVFNSIAPAPGVAEAPLENFGLTARELEILRLVAAGGSNNSIARSLWVAEQTVKFHLSNIYRKLGVTNRTEASHFAHVHRLVAPSVAQPGELERAA
jgi:DNA-binding NarL/FixJ family response regulator